MDREIRSLRGQFLTGTVAASASPCLAKMRGTELSGRSLAVVGDLDAMMRDCGSFSAGSDFANLERQIHSRYRANTGIIGPLRMECIVG